MERFQKGREGKGRKKIVEKLLDVLDRLEMSEERIICLDVGGKTFKTTVGTLIANHDSFFSQMFTNSWKESSLDTVFIDRDYACFPLILSYLRSRRLCIDDDTKDSYLKQALVESDFYGLMDLSEMITVELEKRQQRRAIESQKPTREIQKSIALEQLDSHLSKGWTFVTQFKGNEVLACRKRRTGAQINALDSKCSACGERVDYVQHSAHFASIQPAVVIVKKVDYSPVQVGHSNGNDGGNVSYESRSLHEPVLIDDPDNLVFDASFG